MHPAAEQGFARMLMEAAPWGLASDLDAPELRVLDVGGADVNGTIHGALGPVSALDVVDIEAGPGVTIVADATIYDFWQDLQLKKEPYDLVITTEFFEHISQWPLVIDGVLSVLRPGGWFVGTCASIDRTPHGARGERKPRLHEWYHNISPTHMAQALRTTFAGDVWVEYSWQSRMATTGDLYWRARKGLR